MKFFCLTDANPFGKDYKNICFILNLNLKVNKIQIRYSNNVCLQVWFKGIIIKTRLKKIESFFLFTRFYAGSFLL